MFTSSRVDDSRVVDACAVTSHFSLFTRSSKYKRNVYNNATYSSLGGCSKARSALTTAPYKDKEKLVRIK